MSSSKKTAPHVSKRKRFVLKSRHIIPVLCLTGLLAGAVLLWSQAGGASAVNLLGSSARQREEIDRTVGSVLKSMSQRAHPAIGREFPTSTPGVSFVLESNGDVEFHAPPGFRGVAITPDGRNLYLAN
jgi:hypothetical protein